MSELITTIINAVAGTLVKFLCAILPTSPFQKFIHYIGELKYIEYINWIVPVGVLIAITEAWLTCVLAYYAYRFIMGLIRSTIATIASFTSPL